MNTRDQRCSAMQQRCIERMWYKRTARAGPCMHVNPQASLHGPRRNAALVTGNQQYREDRRIEEFSVYTQLNKDVKGSIIKRTSHAYIVAIHLNLDHISITDQYETPAHGL